MKLHYDLFHFKRYLFVMPFFAVRIVIRLSFMSFVLSFIAVNFLNVYLLFYRF